MEKKSYSWCVLLIFVLIFSSCAYGPKQPSNLELLSSIENAFVDIAATSKPAIVGILARNSKWNNPRWGSGFFFRQDGHILTNDHIVHGAENLNVRLLDGSTLDAKLVGTDINTDIAVLKVDGNQEFPTLPLADSEKVRVGQFAIAIGNPFQLDYTVTTGVVSGKGRSVLGGLRVVLYQNFIQTDAWINTGSSGGPLLNIYGEVIGINALIRKVENTPAPARAGAGFAIPSNLVNTIGDQLIANGKIIRGFLGIEMREAPKGILIRRVGLNTPADKAGLRRHDIITEYNGKKVKKSLEFQMLIAESQIGKESVIKVLRRGQQRTFSVTIVEMPPERSGLPFESESVSWRMLGLAVRKLDKGDSQRYTYLTDNDQGVIVERVKENAPGFNAKIPRGALILAINGKEINDVQALEALLQTQKDALELIIDIKSSHGKEELTVHLQK
ncbi:MAG: trypsin-like peptidase domain-containing protein [Candidatus Poribacteria bacterium]|nr:trypsin-like peptidase domain-containing protein [Candidatus Poribacteria bacterium]